MCFSADEIINNLKGKKLKKYNEKNGEWRILASYKFIFYLFYLIYLFLKFINMALQSEKLFDMMTNFLKENGKTLVPKIKAVYRFDVLDKKGVKQQ